MTEGKDYSAMSLDELELLRKKTRQSELFSAGFIGFNFGVMGFGLVRNGFGWVYVFIPLFLIAAISNNWRSRKKEKELILEEIRKRSGK